MDMHLPEIAALSTPGRWGVFCRACSAEAQDYVYPCKKNWAGLNPTPPATLVAAPEEPSWIGRRA